MAIILPSNNTNLSKASNRFSPFDLNKHGSPGNTITQHNDKTCKYNVATILSIDPPPKCNRVGSLKGGMFFITLAQMLGDLLGKHGNK
eukprot:15357648-Ditylum_brightwellii.AAC.1